MPPIKMKLRTLSPIHIGNGNKIEPFEYITIGSKYYRINLDTCFDYIFSNVEGSLDKFNRWIEESAYNMGQNPNQAVANFQFDIFGFIRNKLNNNNLINDIKNKLVNDPAFRRYSLENHYQLNGRQVSELIKTANNELYIPGSSIKGMLRNVLMNYTIRNMNDKNIISRMINNDRGDRKWFGKKVEEYIFNCGYLKKGKPNYQDAKYDLMKFIQVSDTNTISCEKGGRIVNPQLYKNNGEVQPQVPFIEAIKENIELEFRISIDFQAIRALAKKFSTISKNQRREWLYFESKIKELFGVEIQSIQNDEVVLKKILKILVDSIEDFSAGIIYKEQEWADKNQRQGNAAQKMMHFYKSLPENAIKLGWASGFPGITVFDALTSEENDIEQYIKQNYISSLRRFNIIQNKNVDEFPLSHRFETFSNTKINPIGWVSIEKE